MEQVKVLNAKMTYTKESGFVGQVQFEVAGFPDQYEMTLHSRKQTEWGYGLFFLSESGDEEQLVKVEDMLEEDDELFDYLVNAAQEKLENYTAFEK